MIDLIIPLFWQIWFLNVGLIPHYILWAGILTILDMSIDCHDEFLPFFLKCTCDNISYMYTYNCVCSKVVFLHAICRWYIDVYIIAYIYIHLQWWSICLFLILSQFFLTIIWQWSFLLYYIIYGIEMKFIHLSTELSRLLTIYWNVSEEKMFSVIVFNFMQWEKESGSLDYFHILWLLFHLP